MITSTLLVAAVALCSATSSFGAPIPTTRGSDQNLGRRFPKPYAADSADLVARHPVAAAVVDAVVERRFPRGILYERYAKRDEAKVNINEVVARSPEPVAAATGPSLVEREHTRELEKRMEKRQQRRRSEPKDLYKRTLQKEGVQRRRVDPIAKREAAPAENPSIRSRAFVPPKNLEARDVTNKGDPTVNININLGEIDWSKQTQDVDVYPSGASPSTPTQSSTSGQQGASGQTNPSPSSSGTQTAPTTGTQTPPQQPGNQDPSGSSSSGVAPPSAASPTGSTGTGSTTSTATTGTTTETPAPGQPGWTPGQQPPTGQQQPPTGQQQPPTDPTGQQPPSQQPPAGSTGSTSTGSTSTGSSSTSTGSTSTSTGSTSTSTSTSTPASGGDQQPPSPSQTSTQNSGNHKRAFSIFQARDHPRNFKRVVPAENFAKRDKVGSPIQFKRDV